MISLKTIFTNDILVTALAIIGATTGLLSYFMAKKRTKLDNIRLWSEVTLGISNLEEVISKVRFIKNTDPNELTLQNFSEDKVLLENLILEYKKNQDIIGKVNYEIPLLFRSISNTLTNLEAFFNDKVKKENLTIENEIRRNYRNLFSSLAMLSLHVYIINRNEVRNNDENDMFKYFYNLKTVFQVYELNSLSESYKKLMSAMENLENNLNQ